MRLSKINVLINSLCFLINFSHFKHILECCNYFSEEYGENTGLVTLITGSDDLLESPDLMQMAKSISE